MKITDHFRRLHIYIDKYNLVMTLTSAYVDRYDAAYCFNDYLEELTEAEYNAIPIDHLPLFYLGVLRERLTYYRHEGYGEVSANQFNNRHQTINQLHRLRKIL